MINTFDRKGGLPRLVLGLVPTVRINQIKFSSSFRPCLRGTNDPFPGYPFLRIGYRVDIKRRDGRIHETIVIQLHPEKDSVSVEWTEKDGTMQKTIAIQEVLELNPELVARQE